ncbi:unnamed protein product [Vicia faba]|uniref:Autophagy-related protein n=1 Tax=Vicia faba TaxID=3906 RepID=A0AAV0YSQ6_VICFA|nr:unnamed protein product [Vicia faba]
MSKASFKTQHPFERRHDESTHIRDKYPDRVPVIMEKAGRSDIADIDKKREGYFCFVDNILPPTATLMSSLYEEHKDEDGFLYMTYGGENTFGCQ